MNYLEIRNLCKRGKIGIIPNWTGYLKYNYGKDLLLFVNQDYIMNEEELIDKIKERTDLYYII